MPGHDHSHDHPHDHDHSELSPIELRVRALETLLTDKGYIDPPALDELIETYETKIGPKNGAKVVAKAWSDPAYRQRLQENATAAIASPTTLSRPIRSFHTTHPTSVAPSTMATLLAGKTNGAGSASTARRKHPLRPSETRRSRRCSAA